MVHKCTSSICRWVDIEPLCEMISDEKLFCWNEECLSQDLRPCFVVSLDMWGVVSSGVGPEDKLWQSGKQPRILWGNYPHPQESVRM